MATITGEQYIRTLAQYIRSNERRMFATSSPPPSSHLTGHRRSDSGSFSMTNLWSFSSALTSSYFKPSISTASTTPTSPPGSTDCRKNILITLDLYHLYYLLTRFSDLGLDVGSFEAAVDFKRDDGGILEIDSNDQLETASITSVNSMSSAMSSLSLFTGWQGWYNAAQKNEKIPIKLEIVNIHRAFTKLSGLNLSINTQKKIEGSENWPIGSMLSLTFFKNLTHFEIYGLSPKMFDGWDILQEKLEYLSLQRGSIDDIYDILPPRIWLHLKAINLSDNSLTFVANEPLSYITKCTSLDLSNNLLIAVPAGLSQLYNLQYLNISNNMIESVTGIYDILTNVTKLDLRNNRVENLCGLERMWSLEYVDVRENRLTDWDEIGRMTELPGINQIYVEGNPFTKYQIYRDNGVEIILDGTGPTYNERRQLVTNNKPSVFSLKIPTAVMNDESLLSTSPGKLDDDKPIQVLRTKKSRKFHKRVVKLDGEDENYSGSELAEIKSISSKSGKKKKKDKHLHEVALPKHRLVEVEKAVAAENNPEQTAGEDYRRKIEELRTEGGSAWLRVLSEMEYSKGGGVDRLREPPKMKAVIEQLMGQEQA
ncbi:6399_t:CDS:2 [Diversispora eburnea]|uniref:6399_t:CDS:1 n=1 Tax=Diversispora eburnea TaxID=1213867 RepID=A0A9N9AM73_9GLOM|nr:6399_t:CDS:2 [Diversispora eburnea]